MGGKPSIHIETPEFREEEWQYESTSIVFPEYGIFRTLSNKKTGELIDEYTLSWINEEEYSYYLKSFNWRWNQPNVVNTRFIIQRSQRQFCAQTFSARVYIQHVLSRLSEIKDVPYPDNLFVLMESLEGYSKIYVHSKYFLIEESQICVDAQGNIKVWVNADLSINYPFSQERAFGEQEMVERLVYMIAQNTDRETEPSETFLQFFEETKGPKGKKFQEVKVLVLEYARRNNEMIPTRFESLLTLDKEDQYTEPQEVQMESAMVSQTRETPQTWENRMQSTYHRPSEAIQSHPIAVIPPPQVYYHHPPYHNPMRMSQPVPLTSAIPVFPHHHQTMYSPTFQQQILQMPPPQNLPPPIEIPIYQRVEVPLRQSNQSAQVVQALIQPPSLQGSLNPGIHGSQAQEKKIRSSMRAVQLEVQRPQRQEIIQNEQQLRMVEILDEEIPEDIDVPSPDDIRVTFNKNSNHFVRKQSSPQKQVIQEERYKHDDYFNQFQQSSHENTYHHQSNPRTGHYRNSSHQEPSNNSISEAEDMVARSLPIKGGLPGQPSQQLSAFGQSDRSTFSHVNPGEQWHGNIDGFGLTDQRKKEGGLGNSKKMAMGSRISNRETKSIRYYFSLEQELEIDPDIAADLAKYLT